MFATTSPRMRPRRLSAGSFDSNPDTSVDEHEGDNNYLTNGNAAGGGGLRVPTPHPSMHGRPPRDSLVRQSLLEPPSPEPPRRSFIPYSEFGYHESRPPTVHHPRQVSHEHSYVDVEENMEIDPNYGPRDQHDEEFARRGYRPPRPSRFRHFANVLLSPFRAAKSVFRIPRFLRRNRSSTRPVTRSRSSGWDFRDPTPAPTSIRNQHSNEGGERAPENVTMLFPQPMTAPVTLFGTPTEPGQAPRNERHSGSTDSARGHSTTHHSHASRRAPSHRTAHSHEGTIKANGDAVRSSGTTRTSRNTRTSFSPFSPIARRASTIKESSRERSSRAFSSVSHCSSLLHQFVRLFNAIRALYHLPWIAAPPRRIAADFIPAFGERSKYRVHRGPPQVPPSVLVAATAARNMEPSEGKSWYRPSPQQVEKQLKRGKGAKHHQHSHPHSHSHSLANACVHLLPDDPRIQQGQPPYAYNPGVPPFPQASPYGAQPFYMLPGPPPPNPAAQASNGAGGNGNGLRAPPLGRPPSLRPGPHPVQNSSNPPQTQSPDPNTTNMPRTDIQRPPPAAQPMYMLVQAPPGPPLPPSYGNVYSYPYTPPWTPPSQRI